MFFFQANNPATVKKVNICLKTVGINKYMVELQQGFFFHLYTFMTETSIRTTGCMSTKITQEELCCLPIFD